MKLLITGICGFVGSSIARRWLERSPGVSIYGLDNFSRPGSECNRREMQRHGIKLFHGDIRVMSDFESLPPVDWVIDAAAYPSVLAGVDGQSSSRQLIDNNLYGTVNMLEYCKKHGAGFILMSTSRVYSIQKLSEVPVEVAGNKFIIANDLNLPQGLSPAGVKESFSTDPPISLYGSSKLASEIIALEFGATFGFPVWVNRCGVLAGAGQFGRIDQGIIAYWVNSWVRRRPLAYIGFGGSGYQVRDCLHPFDLVPLLEKQTASGALSEPRLVNLGGGATNAFSLAELSEWCKERFGRYDVASVTEVRKFDIPWLVMDSRLAEEVWGWKPTTRLNSILEEIAVHAEQHPEWLDMSAHG
jgi:CDP-paratose 2-epimerase